MGFKPNVNDIIDFDGLTYRFMPHPAVQAMVHGQAGKAAVVYKVEDHQHEYFALKVFRQAFQLPDILVSAARLARFADLPALGVCQRRVVDPAVHIQLLAQHPDLKYAVVMPWIDGETWFEVIDQKKVLDEAACRSLVASWVQNLGSMERAGVAHGDVSGQNVIINFSTMSTMLVDVEGMFAADLPNPKFKTGGTVGYAFPPTLSTGVWSAEGDRFAGAVLLAEILGWCDDRIRNGSSDGQYFDRDEIQKNCTRLDTLLVVLKEHWGETIARLFEQAWRARKLSECPSFLDWSQALRLTGPGGTLLVEADETEPEGEPISLEIDVTQIQAAIGLLADKQSVTNGVFTGTVALPDEPVEEEEFEQQPTRSLIEVTLDKAGILLQMGRFEQAIALLDEVRPAEPEKTAGPYSYALAQRAEDKRQKGDIKGARADYQLAATLTPDYGQRTTWQALADDLRRQLEPPPPPVRPPSLPPDPFVESIPDAPGEVVPTPNRSWMVWAAVLVVIAFICVGILGLGGVGAALFLPTAVQAATEVEKSPTSVPVSPASTTVPTLAPTRTRTNTVEPPTATRTDTQPAPPTATNRPPSTNTPPPVVSTSPPSATVFVQNGSTVDLTIALQGPNTLTITVPSGGQRVINVAVGTYTYTVSGSNINQSTDTISFSSGEQTWLLSP